MAKILLVEDDKSLREIYGVRLLAEGYDIVSAGDGEEALAMAIKEKPQLIVSDVMMPKISGFDMLDILRSTTETKDIKVIMMTALSSEDQRLRGQQLGADRYLVKSQVGIEDVVRTVHEVLADAPVTAAGNAFAPSAPSAVAKPTAPAPVPSSTASTVPDASTAAPVTPPPAAPVASEPVIVPPSSPTPSPDPTPTPAPTIPAPPTPVDEPVSAVPTSPTASAASTLPQPTAPFSTARPAGLADRIIQPLERPVESPEPIADLMNKELGVAPTPAQAPASEPTADEPAPKEDHGIAFEEIPRAPTNGQAS